jgi:hypothetical protein
MCHEALILDSSGAADKYEQEVSALWDDRTILGYF